MPDNSNQRIFNLSDAELPILTQHICDSIMRDITEFTPFGVTSSNVCSLQSLCDAFEIFPTDEYIYQEYLSATEEKDILKERLRLIVRNMALRVELKWGKNSSKYRSLGISNMSKITEEAFIQRARMIFDFMTANLAILSTEGLTQDLLDEMEATIQELEDAKRTQIDKNSLRIDKTIERIEKANELYALVARYCEIGKRIWDGIDPAKYKDYMING